MQMGFDFQNGSQGSVPRSQTGEFGGLWTARADSMPHGLVPGRPDWASLRARFVAIHALRRSMAVGNDTVPAGSFVAAGEAVLASARGQGDVVNRLCSGNGKAVFGMIAPLSPISPTRGDRGPE